MSVLDLRKDLFLCPVVFESDKIDENNIPLQLSEPDKELHFTLTVWMSCLMVWRLQRSPSAETSI